MLLEVLKKAVFQDHATTDVKGLFLSVFNKAGEPLMSNGVVVTDKKLEDLVGMLYNGLVAKQPAAHTIVADVVTQIQEVASLEEVLQYDVAKYGFTLISADKTKSGSILPNTEGVTSAQQAVQLIQDKYQLSGDLSIFAFESARIIVEDN